MSTREEAVSVVETFFDGLRKRDGARILLTPSAVFESPMSRELISGGPEVAAFLTNIAAIVKAVRVHQLIVELPHVCARWEFDTTEPETLIPACAYFRLEDGRIAQIRAYHDPRPFTNAKAIALLRGY